MEGSINNTNFNIESIFSKFTNASKNARNSLALNQQIREAIERYTNSVSVGNPASSPLLDAQSTSSNQLSNNLAVSMVRNDEEVSKIRTGGTRQIHCSECPRILPSRKTFIKHAEDDHGLVLPIIVLRNELTGKIEVEGCLEHTGHELTVILHKNDNSNLRKTNTGANWLNEGASFPQAQIEVGDSSYLNRSGSTKDETEVELHSSDPGELDDDIEEIKAIQVDVLNSNYSVDTNNSILNLFNILKQQCEFDKNKKISKKEATPSDEMIASSSSEIIQTNENHSKNYVNVELERRKLAMVEQFQAALKNVHEKSIDGAEAALRYFLRELSTLTK